MTIPFLPLTELARLLEKPPKRDNYSVTLKTIRICKHLSIAYWLKYD